MSDCNRQLTAAETNALLILVDMIIPASEDLALPSASDPQIFADIVNTLQRQQEKVRDALSALDAVAYDEVGNDFCGSEIRERTAIVESFRRTHVGAADLFATLTVQCYYRDSRVMRLLNMEPRAPYPRGFEVDQGNWSLLAPVRDRTPIFRKPP